MYYVENTMKKKRIFYDRNRLLGKGFFGFVCLGELLTEDGNRQDVAVKVVWANASSREGDRELVQMRLDHPNVVKLLHHEYQADDELSCFALELCDVSLDKVFEDRRNGGTNYQKLLPSQLEFILQLSLGLEYIHTQNLVHRDIKSGNVLISKSFHNGEPLVKWADFGLAKSTNPRGEFEMSGQRGTDLYWAPEICSIWENSDRFEKNKSDGRSDIITKMSDVFSSGIVFFEFCTNGIHPFGNGLNQIRTNLLQLNAFNMNREPKLRQSHFAFKMIKTMLKGEPQTRPNLREIILSCSSLKKMVSISRSILNQTKENQQTDQVDRDSCPIQQQDVEQKETEYAYQKLEKDKGELHYLCSLASPTEKQTGRISEIVSNDLVGIINAVDENGFSPLLLMCLNNQSLNLHESIKALITTKRKIEAEWLKVDVNYQDRFGYNAFHYISKNYLGTDFLEIMELLLECGLDVNLTEQELERNALQLLLRDNRRDDIVQIIEALIKAGINLKHKNLNGSTALSYLCQCYTTDNLIQIAHLLIENGVDVTEKDEPYGWTALHVLCRYYTNPNLIEVAKLLLSNGVDVTAKECEGWTALHFLCGYYAHENLIEVVELLIEKEVDVNAKAQNGWTALHSLCRHYAHKNLLKVAKLLIEKGIDVNAKDFNGCTAFHFMCRHYTHDNLIELAELFIENGFDVKAKQSDEWSTLHLLCRHYSHPNLINVVKLLIEKGVDVTAKEDKEWTALHFLCRYYNQDNLIEIAKLLIEKDVDINAHQSDGWTALHLLCGFYTHDNLFEVAKLLLDNGANVAAKVSCDGSTPLHILCRYYAHETLIDVAKLLIEKGVDVNAKKPNGWTALHLLCRHYTQYNLIDVAKLLFESGVGMHLKTQNGRTAYDLLHFSSPYNHGNKSKILELLNEERIQRNIYNYNCEIL